MSELRFVTFRRADRDIPIAFPIDAIRLVVHCDDFVRLYIQDAARFIGVEPLPTKAHAEFLKNFISLEEDTWVNPIHVTMLEREYDPVTPFAVVTVTGGTTLMCRKLSFDEFLFRAENTRIVKQKL